MAITTASSVSYKSSAATTSFTSQLPSAYQAGDLLLASVIFSGSGSAGYPSCTTAGWTQLYSACGYGVFYKLATSSSETAPVFTNPSVTGYTQVAANWVGTTVAMRGVDQTAPIDTFAFRAGVLPSGSMAAMSTAPSLCPGYANDCLIYCHGNNANNTGNAPSGFTSIGSSNGNSLFTRLGLLQLASASKTPAYAGAMTGTNSGGVAVTGVIALKTAGDTPVAAAPGFPQLAATVWGAHSTGSVANGATATVPFGNTFATGDLLLLHLTSQSPWAPPDNSWTLLCAGDAVTGSYEYTWYKTATSGQSSNAVLTATAAGTAGYTVTGQVIKAYAAGTKQAAIDTYTQTTYNGKTSLPPISAMTPASTGELFLSKFDNTYPGAITISQAVGSTGVLVHGADAAGENASFGWLDASPNPSPSFGATASNAYGHGSSVGILIQLVTTSSFALLGSQAKGYGRTVSTDRALAPPGKQALAKSGLTALGSAAALLGAQANAYGRAVAPAIGPVLLNAKALAPIGVLSPSSTIGLTGAAANGYAGIVLVAAGVLVDLTGVQALGRSGQVLTELAPVLLRGRALAKSGIPVAARTVSAGGMSAASYGRQVGPQTELAARGRAADALTGALELQQTFGVTRAAADAFAGRVMTTSDFVARLTGQRAVAKAGRAVYAPELFTWWVTAAARGGKVGKTSAVQVPRQAADGVVGQLGFSEGANRTLAAARAAAQAHRIPAQISIALLPAAAAGRAGALLPAGQLIGQLAEARAGRFPATLQLALEGYRAIARAGQPGFGEGSGTPIGVWTGPSYAAPLSQVPHAAPTTGEVGALATTGQQTATTVTQKTAVASILSPNNIFIVSD